MTQKEFFRKVTNQKKDLLEEFTEILKKRKIPFCIIGGLAVNAYAEPVVSLDLDTVIIIKCLSKLLTILKKKYKVKKYPNSVNITCPYSDLRIQIQTDPRYQKFIPKAKYKNVLGYKLPVATIEDVLRGKIWAVEDKTRRASRRQKDLSDILRLIEVKKSLIKLIPTSLKSKLSF